MRALPSVYRQLTLWCLTLCASVSFGCEQISSGGAIWIRLTEQVSTYNAKVGDPIHAVLTEELMCGPEVVAPIGAPVEGTVLSVRKVGYGVRHETAALQLGFNKIVLPDGELPIQVVLASIDNAREQVTNGTVHGIRSTCTPQGRITSKLIEVPSFTLAGLNPYQDVGLLVFKATFPIFPEPEIYLPAGTDMQLRLSQALQDPPVRAAVRTEPMPVDQAALYNFVASLPRRSTTLDMEQADLVNLVFLGSGEQLQAAFANAGWQTSDTYDKKAFMRTFYAFLNNSAYSHNPMRPFLLEGQPSVMTWQKSLNSYAKRDHLRIWRWTEPLDGESVWVSSSTHDTSASLSVTHREFVHHISPEIDEERSKVIRDLKAAGCVQSVEMVPRQHVSNLTQNYVGDMVKTDGAVAVVQLQNCHAPVPELASSPTSVPYKPGNIVFRYMRRQVLTFRSDIWRANIIYGAYDLGRMTVKAWKNHEAVSASTLGMKKSETTGESSGAVGAASVME